MLSLVTVALFGLTATCAPVEIEVRDAPAIKRGYAYNDAALVGKFSTSKINWAYNWASSETGLSSSLEYVPMLWGLGDKLTYWNANTAKLVKYAHLLSFNEPDMAAQANMSPAAAAAAYKKYMHTPFAGKGPRLGSPAVTNSGTAGQGLDWLKSFMAACTGCQIDFVAIHWYDTNGNFDYFKQHIQDAYTQTKKPIWITEFGYYGASTQAQADFIAKAVAWLDQQSFVYRYAYFDVDAVLTTNGALNAAGTKYETA